MEIDKDKHDSLFVIPFSVILGWIIGKPLL